jgi:penicillin amidase
MIEAIYRPLLGDSTWRWVNSPANATSKGIIARWFYGLGVTIADDSDPKTPDGRKINALMEDSLEIGWNKAQEIGGEDTAAWRWGLHHQTAAKHTLSGMEPSSMILDPPPAEMGGDGDTVQVSSVSTDPRGRVSFPVGALSVYRQVVDFSKPEDGLWIIPGGASGIPDSPHYSDQLALWANHELIPMNHAVDAARSAAVTTDVVNRSQQ